MPAVIAEPVLLGPNQPERPYLGGAGIARLRGTPQPGDHAPEDFVGSTTEAASGGGVGLTVLDDGTVLRDRIAGDPIPVLGAAHVARFGASTELLVKLLSTGQRLFVHYHPDGPFPQDHLGSPKGKTEAWIITETEDDDAAAWVGFQREVDPNEVAGWFEEQDVEALLGAMNRVPLRAGDTLFVPAGLPHAIGPGITLVELQEPTDWSIILEYRGFELLDPGSVLMGLDTATAIQGVDRSAWDASRLRGLADAGTQPLEPASRRLFPDEADAFFRAEEWIVDGEAAIEPGFSILVVLDGDGALGWADGELPVRRGSTVLVPDAAGEIVLRGTLRLLRCRPPAA